MTQLGDGIVWVMQVDVHAETLRQVTGDERQRQRVGLVAGDADEGRSRWRLLTHAARLSLGLVEEKQGEDVARRGVGDPGDIFAPLAAAHQAGEPRLNGVACVGSEPANAKLNDPAHGSIVGAVFSRYAL